MIFLENLQNLFAQSVPDLVIKYNIKAKQYETIETKRDGGRYVAARLKTDTFHNYQNFSVKVLMNAGFNEADAVKYSENKSLIPYTKRDAVLEAQRTDIIENYVEQNNYYRMLYGLPDVDDIEEYWLPPSVYIEKDIIPMAVHKLDYNTRLSLEALGYFDELIASHPDKEYLKFLGRKRVDITVSRIAGEFEILYFPRISGQDIFYKDFINIYESCREYFLTVIYNNYYSGKYDYYDNYLAFNILIMTINRMISDALKRFKRREFYDISTMQIFLNAYGLPYSDKFSEQQLRLLCKNLNILLQSKCTSKVFVDIMSLLKYDNFKVMKYYLVKQHIVDPETDKPVFIYKKDEEGNDTDELDMDAMYNFYFVHTDIDNYNIQENIHDNKKIVPYDILTKNDDYWVEDSTLKEKLLSSKFNYIETKYIDMDVIYRMQKILFDTCYLSRTILDNEESKEIKITLSKVVSNEVRLFDVIVFLICMMCKVYNIKPSILTTPSKVLYVSEFDFNQDLTAVIQDIEGVSKTIPDTYLMGINYNVDLNEIHQIMMNNPQYYDPTLLAYVKSLVIKDVNAINDIFGNLKKLQDMIIDRMGRCETIEAYTAYDKLYRMLYYVELNNDKFKLKDGSVAKTYDEYLRQNDFNLYSRYMSLTDESSISDTISYVVDRLSNLFQNATWLNQINTLDKSQTAAILNLLKFFKSYTVDMIGANVILMLDDKYLNTMHFLHQVRFAKPGEKTILEIDDMLFDELYDGIARELAEIHHNEINSLTDKAKYQVDQIEEIKLDMSKKSRIKDGHQTQSVYGQINMPNKLINGAINYMSEVPLIAQDNCNISSDIIIGNSTAISFRDTIRFKYSD